MAMQNPEKMGLSRRSIVFVGVPQARWMVYFMENPNIKWMMTFFIFFTCKKSSCIPILGSPPYGQKKC
jgi:hypothetical protein